MKINEEALIANNEGQPHPAALWGIVAFVLAILMCVFNNSPAVLGAGFLVKCFAVFVGTITGTIGGIIGSAICRFAAPSFIITNGGIGSILWTKIFWKMGPQTIGLIGGIAVGMGIVLH